MRVALITGGSRGFGLATARALARDGFSIGLIARSSSDLDDARGDLINKGAVVSISPADVTDRLQVNAAVDAIESELGPVAALVNNAGSLSAIGPLWEAEPREWWADVESSLRGAFNLCHRVIPGMIERGEGRIVNISSYVATRPTPYQSGYSCGKAAMLSLTDALAASLSDLNVKVFSVTPGFVVTQMTRRLMDSSEGRRWAPEAGRGTIVEPEVGAQLVARICSGGADQLNGRFLHALDDIDELLSQLQAIERDDLYAFRLRRLPEPS